MVDRNKILSDLSKFAVDAMSTFSGVKEEIETIVSLRVNKIIKKMNSKEEQTNSEVSNLKNGSLIKQQKDPNYINEQIGDNKLGEKSKEIKDEYKFGWSSYSEKTNGRFAMIGFLSIILIELFSKQSFLKWVGIL